MATEAQLAANRANAQLSSGPTTVAGRAAVSQNATKHGLTGEFKTQSEQELEELKLIVKTLEHDYNASTPTEFQIILKMAEAQVRSTRAMFLQDGCFTFIESGDEELAARGRKELDLYIRYQAHHDRTYQRYAAELRKFQSEKKKAEIGSVSLQRVEAQEQRAQAQETRRANDEIRREERHQKAILLDNARLEHRQLLNRKLAGEILPIASAEIGHAGDLLAA